jgi:hypothetical protein
MRNKLAALLIAALALTGCTSAPDEAPTTSTPSAAPVVAESESAPVENVIVRSAEQVKKSALKAGRPIAAFDKDCEVWEMPKIDSDGQAWANKLGAEWLKSQGAACPDQITFPGYYVESFSQGTKGEIVVTLDNAALVESAVKRDSDTELERMAEDFAASLSRETDNFETVTFTVDNSARSVTVAR